jgi:phosphatidylinositol glycan class O
MPTLFLYSMSFISNSYTFWEDRAIPFFLFFTHIRPLLTVLSVPTTRLWYRTLAFSVIFATCVRLIAISTVCREEEHLW